MAQIFLSLISADLLNLQTVLKTLDPYCDGYHLDIMDYHFVPNLTWGPAFIHAISAATQRTLWVHLMVDNPMTWVEKLKLPAGSIVDFHIETNVDALKIINDIHEKKWLAGIAISPKTDVAKTFSLLNVIDHVTVMSVEPGFSGQHFMPEMLLKVDALVEYRNTHNLSFSIGMDGGINKNTIRTVVEKGVDVCAIAQGIFGQPNPLVALQELKKLITR